MSNIVKFERRQDSGGQREIRIKLPSMPKLPKDKSLLIVGGLSFLMAFIGVSSLLKEISKLKEQQTTMEERIKKEVLMPGGTTEYKAEFKLDPKRDTAKDAVTEVTAPESATTVAPAPVAPRPAPAPVAPAPAPVPSGPGNFAQDTPYSGATGPGNY